MCTAAVPWRNRAISRGTVYEARWVTTISHLFIFQKSKCAMVPPSLLAGIAAATWNGDVPRAKSGKNETRSREMSSVSFSLKIA